MSTFAAIWQGLDWSYITDRLLNVIPALICITLHELAHGATALALGDTTARDAGRLTLNPLKHIDIWGLLLMVVCRFGWAKPVPVNMYRFKNPKRGMAVTAVAGPLANVLIACVAMALYGLLYLPLYDSAVGSYILTGISITAYMSCGLAVFNILPVPPLDGSKILFSLLNQKQYNFLMRYEKYGFLLLIVLVWTDIISGPLSTVTYWLFDRLFGIAEFFFGLVA